MTEKRSPFNSPEPSVHDISYPADEFGNLSDPFSEENETTLMEKSPLPQNQDVLSDDDKFEVTEKSHVDFLLSDDEDTLVRKMRNQNKAKMPAQNTVQTEFLTPKRKNIILLILSPIALILFLGTIYIAQVLIPSFGVQEKKIKTAIPQNLLPPQDHNIQLSELDVMSEFSGLMPQIHAGELFETQFSLTNWQTPPQKPLRFRVSAKIYDDKNKLLVSQPHYKSFQQLAQAEAESIVVKNQLQLSTATPAGLYRIVFEVIDESSQQAKTLQTPFRVLSKR